ncbi:MAG: hypothetical protein C0483_22270 [Pirellula sp.]|nr:hypothetical protein [Pirellula sp.]
MSASPFVLLLAQLAVMLICGLIGGALMRLARQPAVLGEMIGGVILGPTVLGAIAPEWQAGLFPTAGAASALRNSVIKFGMLFFMFMVGLEINARGILRNGVIALSVGLLGTLAPLVLGIALVYAVPSLFHITPAADKFIVALFIGAAMANSANPVLARILSDLGLLKDRLGAILMSATVVDDLVSWTLLFVVFEQMNNTVGDTTTAVAVGSEIVAVLGFFVATLAVGWITSRIVSRWHERRPSQVAGRIGLLSALVLLTAAAAEHLQIHAFLGPFLFGIALTPTEDEAEDETYEGIRRFSYGVFVPIYFVSLGLTTDFIAHFVPLLVLLVLVVACVGKIPAAYLGARIGGLDARSSWGVGWGMNARGATGIILANVGLEKGVIDQPTYVALVVMALATSIMAAPLMKRCFAARSPLPTGSSAVVAGA